MFLRLAAGLLLRATRIAGPDRQGLERLCRYVARPALAAGRLRVLDSERLTFALKTPWSDGTSHLLLSPMDLLARVFSVDLSECAACGGRLRIIAALTDPASIRTYLEGVGLPAVPPPRASPPPQFEFAA